MLRELPGGYGLLIRGGRAPVLAKLPRAWTDREYKRARRQGRAVYRAPVSAILPVPLEFALPVTEAPGPARGDGSGRPADGNGHRKAAGFPWGGEER